MKVIAGEYRGRNLKAVPGQDVRPTPSSLRETLFDVLGASVRGAVFLDAYAGSGSVGIEAFSRGAASVGFIESSDVAIRSIQENLSSLGIATGYKIVRIPARKALIRLGEEKAQFDIVFADPPYDAHREYSHFLEWIGENRVLSPNGKVIVQHSKRDEVPEHRGGFERYRLLTQGSSAFSFYHAVSPEGSPA